MPILRNVVFTLGFALITAQASAINITTSLLGSYTGSWSSMAVDPVTGKAYRTTHYNDANVTAYSSAATFEARQASGSLNNATHFGTYLAANNGSLYMRTGSSTSATVSQVSATNGTVLKTVNVTGGMGGINGPDTFEWGGYSGVNMMNDGNRLYAVGGVAANNQWSIATFDYALNQTKSVTFDLLNGRAGFAFAVNGYVFFGDSSSSTGHISRRVDASTGAVSAVDFTLTGLPATWVSGISYDSLHDSLYVTAYSNSTGVNVAKAVNVAQQLGLPRSSVPEPGTMAVFGLGLAALGLARRRRSAAQ